MDFSRLLSSKKTGRFLFLNTIYYVFLILVGAFSLVALMGKYEAERSKIRIPSQREPGGASISHISNSAYIPAVLRTQ